MESERLRALERKFKIRVKTGCTTCRIRRVKCDETKPACLRCSKTGRKCEGYRDPALSRKPSPAAAATYRNSSFLSIPAAAVRLPRSPSPLLFDNPNENRSFAYFQARTLPQWTEFFDSELWNRDILRMMFHEPAIKHGVLALSTMHELYDTDSKTMTARGGDYAFKQYTKALTRSNTLLATYQDGKTPIETVLVACVIFVCYESLIGNYTALSMHLCNGLRILEQHKRQLTQGAGLQNEIAEVLHRFDFQSMTFSDNSCPYIFSEKAPTLPTVPAAYLSTTAARTDLVELLRSMMWISNVALDLKSPGNPDPRDAPRPTQEFIKASAQLVVTFQAWATAFEAYCKTLSVLELQSTKIYAGVTLLRMYALVCRIIVASTGAVAEMCYDAHIEDFRSVVGLAATLPAFKLPDTPIASPPSSDSPPSARSTLRRTRTASNSPLSTSPPQSQLPTRFRPLAPAPPASIPTSNPAPTSHSDGHHSRPHSFSPSFELSPIVPLFVIITRCRDPILRRRAISLLLQSRRREGAWDSVGAAAVGAEITKIEEGIVEWDSWAEDGQWGGEGEVTAPPLGLVTDMSEIPEEMRVRETNTWVSIEKRTVEVEFVRGAERLRRTVRF